MKERVRIGTRGSILALYQAELVQKKLVTHYPELKVEVTIIKTSGDQIQDKSLADIGGKGLFVKEIEHALVDDRVDLAVHSMKDVPHTLPEDLAISTVLEREDVRDVFIFANGFGLADLDKGGILGTGSLRRELQLKRLFPKCGIGMIRGNVDTRLRKLESGQFNGIVLAAAGLKRLGYAKRIAHYIPKNQCLPSGGQGVIGIEIRRSDLWLGDLLRPFNHLKTWQEIVAERSFLRRLGVDCHTPVAVNAECDGSALTIRGMVIDPNGKRIVEWDGGGKAEDGEELGTMLAESILEHGGRELLESF